MHAVVAHLSFSVKKYYVTGVVLLHGPLYGVLHRSDNVSYMVSIIVPTQNNIASVRKDFGHSKETKSEL